MNKIKNSVIENIKNDVRNQLTFDGRKKVFDDETELSSEFMKESAEPEAFTKDFVIKKVIDNFELETLSEKQFETPTGKDRSVDYRIKNQRGSMFLVEAKPIHADLYKTGKFGAVNQIKGIFKLAEARDDYDFGVATDGFKWIFIDNNGEIVNELNLENNFEEIKEFLVGKERVISQKTEEEISKKFYDWYNALLHGGRYKDHKGKIQNFSEQDCFVNNVLNVQNLEDREQIAQVVMNRLIFIKFLQSKNVIGEDLLKYLSELEDDVIHFKLMHLFFWVLNAPTDKRSHVVKRFNKIPYLNGSLFTRTDVEDKNQNYEINAEILRKVIEFLDSFQFVHKESFESKGSLDPEILGYIFERAMTATDRKGTGAYYTPKQITKYISENTIYPFIIDRVNEFLVNEKGYKETELIENIDKLFILSETTLEDIWIRIVMEIKVLDNACGSGAFLLAAANILFDLNKKIAERLGTKKDEDIGIKKSILINNIFGVDLNPNATEIAKLRLWLWLVDSYDAEHIQPLPNIDYNIRYGNSLIGYTDISKFETTRVAQMTLNDFEDDDKSSLRNLLNKRIELLKNYKPASGTEAKELKEEIHKMNEDIRFLLNRNLYKEFQQNKIKISTDEFMDLKPFHWGFEFYNVVKGGGFDVVVGNPPYVDIKAMDSKDVKILFNLFKTAENRINLYPIFIEASLSILNKQGYFGYINPNSILFNDSYKKIRTLLLEKTNLRNIVRLPDDVFPGIKVETIIFIFKNIEKITKKTDIIIYGIDDKIHTVGYENCKLHRFVSQSNWDDNDKRIFRIFSNEKTLEILKHIENKSKKLIELCDFSLGVTPYDKYKGHTREQIEKKVFHSDHKKDETFKKLLSGSDITRYNISWNGKKWISYGDWLGASRSQKFFTNPRILVRQIVSGTPPRIYASYIDKEYYNAQIAFNVLVKNNDIIHEKVLLSILNSKLMNFYHTEKFLDKSKRLFQKILILNAKLLPIKIPQNQKPFMELADKMLSLNECLKEITDDEERLKIGEEIKKTDGEIDKLVYEIYGLTNEEIKIVENV